jgi:hypothetical protein
VAKAASAVDGKVAALVGEPTPILETPKTVNFMTVNDSLTALIALVDGADFAPSEESFASYRRLCTGSNGALGVWQELKSKDVTDLNTLLLQSGLGSLPQYPNIAIDDACETQ